MKDRKLSLFAEEMTIYLKRKNPKITGQLLELLRVKEGPEYKVSFHKSLIFLYARNN